MGVVHNSGLVEGLIGVEAFGLSGVVERFTRRDNTTQSEWELGMSCLG